MTTPLFPMLRTVAANPRMLLVKPQASLFMAGYMKRFPVRRFGDNLIVHSHLPALNSRAYSRFVAHHLVGPQARAVPRPGRPHQRLPAELRVLLQQAADRHAHGHSHHPPGHRRSARRRGLLAGAHRRRAAAQPRHRRHRGPRLPRHGGQAVHHRLRPHAAVGPRPRRRRTLLRLRQPRSLGARAPQRLPPLPARLSGGPRGHRHLQTGARPARGRLVGAQPRDDPDRPGGAPAQLPRVPRHRRGLAERAQALGGGVLVRPPGDQRGRTARARPPAGRLQPAGQVHRRHDRQLPGPLRGRRDLRLQRRLQDGLRRRLRRCQPLRVRAGRRSATSASVR